MFTTLYEKLAGSPIDSLQSKRHQRRSGDSTTSEGPCSESIIPTEVANELQSQMEAIVACQNNFIDCIISVTNTRVSAQRLCYRLDSDLYAYYNNPESRERLKLARLKVQEWIRDVQQKLLCHDRYISTHLPPLAKSGYRRRQKRTAYEVKREKYLRALRVRISEFVAILDQQKRDLKEVCNDYCQFITQQYHSVNQYISPQDIKIFVSSLDKPFLLPKSNERGDQVADFENNLNVKIIVTEILYRRQDLHLILDTLRLIDSVSPPLKVIEHRFLLNSFSQGYRDEYLDQEDEENEGESDSDSVHSEASEDLIVVSPPKGLAQRIMGVFGSRRANQFVDANEEDADYEESLNKELEVDSDEEEEAGSATSRLGRRHSRNAEFRLLGDEQGESMLSRARRMVHTRAGRHLMLAVLLLLGTLVLVLVLLVEIQHF